MKRIFALVLVVMLIFTLSAWATISENTKHAWDHGLIQRGGVKARGR